MSALDDSPDRGEQVHRGHDLEAGVLQRVREWPDVFPWVRLGRVLRVAGSPPLLLAVAGAILLWSAALAWFDGELATGELALAAAQRGTEGAGAAADAGGGGPALEWIADTIAWWWRLPWAARLWRLAWSLIVWAPVALLLVRQGALLCAGRELAGIGQALRQAVWRTPAAWAAGAMPLIGVVLVGLPIAVIGWIERAAGGLGWWESPLAAVVVLVAIPCGVLSFGALVATPLSWAAIVNEPTPDPLDALSRGYEYLLRRPLQLVMYLGVSVVLVGVLGALAWSVARAASLSARWLLGAALPLPAGGEAASGVAATADLWLRFLPIVTCVALSWGLVGGVYLLLRRDAGGQEVEDLWQPRPPQRPQPLPPLPRD